VCSDSLRNQLHSTRRNILQPVQECDDEDLLLKWWGLKGPWPPDSFRRPWVFLEWGQVNREGPWTVALGTLWSLSGSARCCAVLRKHCSSATICSRSLFSVDCHTCTMSVLTGIRNRLCHDLKWRTARQLSLQFLDQYNTIHGSWRWRQPMMSPLRRC
jgi:hypothetical protein